jgi:hypothetical protein
MTRSNRNPSISELISIVNKVRFSIQTWIRQEIVDDDPYDVDTLFDSECNSESSRLPLAGDRSQKTR